MFGALLPQAGSVHGRQTAPAPAPALLPYQGETGRLSASLMIPEGEASVKCWGF